MVDPPPRCLAQRYRLDRPLGRGGMGEVWAGHDLRLGRPVAIKLLRRDMAQLAEPRLRFEGEATAAAQLVDPHVVAIFDTGEDAGLPFIVMELLSGETLREELLRGRLDSGSARALADQLLSALTVAHDAGILHRDIKPGNVLRAGPDAWKLADFGIAKRVRATTEVTLTGLVPGTPAYLAPERLAGDPATPAADLYSVGVLLYEALSGRRPGASGTPIDQLRPDVDRALLATVSRATQRDPRRRFGSAAAMRAALHPDRTSTRTGPAEAATEPIRPSPRSLAQHRGATRTLPPRRPPVRRRADRRWRWAALVVGDAVAVVGVVLVAVTVRHGTSSPATPTSIATLVTSPASNLPGPLARALHDLDQQVQR